MTAVRLRRSERAARAIRTVKRERTTRRQGPEDVMVRLAGTLLLVAALVGCGGGVTPPVTENPVPTLTSISPTSKPVGSADFTLTVNGSNFISGSVVRWNGSGRATTFVSSAQLTATILASDITAAGTAQVTVFNPTPGGGTSAASTFTIGNPAPTLTSLSPTSAVAGGAAFTLTVNGSNFVSNSVVRWSGSDRTTTFVSGAQLTASILAGDIASAGTAQVTVFNAAPGGGTSSSLTFTVTALQAMAITTSVLPASAAAKSYYFLLTSTGGAPPITWSVPPGGLPAGLQLDATTGLISGTVTGGTATFAATVTDSSVPTPNVATRNLTIQVLPSLGRNDTCTAGTTAGTTTISNGRLRASISPYGDIDIYSFSGTAGAQVTIEIFAQRLDLDGDASTQDSYLDSVAELLDGNCSFLTYNDDINPSIIVDSRIKNYTLPSDGTYFIRIRDFRGDGRPDLIYELSLSGAD